MLLNPERCLYGNNVFSSMDCESPRALVPRRHMRVYELSYMAGRVGPAGLSLFAVTEEHTTGVYSVERRRAMLKRMMSKVIKDTHALGRESMDMILRECFNAAIEMTRHTSTMGTFKSSTQSCHIG